MLLGHQCPSPQVLGVRVHGIVFGPLQEVKGLGPLCPWVWGVQRAREELPEIPRKRPRNSQNSPDWRSSEDLELF